MVYIQFAVELVPGLLAYLRDALLVGAEVTDESLYSLWLDDVVASFEWDFFRRGDRLDRDAQPSEIIFVESLMGANHSPRRVFGYSIYLQAWDTELMQLPVEPDDIPRWVNNKPEWLNRIIVLVWAPVGWQGSLPSLPAA